jgi:uncharacterized membrane protein
MTPAFAATPAVSTTVRGTVTKILPNVDPSLQPGYQIRITSGASKGTIITISSDQPVTQTGSHVYAVGDRVMVDQYEDSDQQVRYVITEYQRQSALWILLVLFLLAVVWLSRWRGIRSLVGLTVSFVVMIGWMVPSIANGGSPVPITIAGSIVMLTFSLLITEGLSRRTWASLLGLTLSMLIIGALSIWSISFSHLTGLSSEEANYLQNLSSGTIDIRGLLLAGFIIGTLGILADVGIGQVATVAELRGEQPAIPNNILYARAMRVGLSHLSAIIHTLVLAYAGAALPLLVLFSIGNTPVGTTLNSEVMATEIIRTIVGSIGLVLALPLTTWAAIVLRVTPDESGHGHAHYH